MSKNIPVGKTLYTIFDGDGWVMVMDHVVFHWHEGTPITTPKKFSSNGGSIPKVFWPLLGGGKDRYLAAYILHDWLYDPRCDVKVTRKNADKLLYFYLREMGMCWLKAQAIYSGVRIGGGRSWRTPKNKPTMADFTQERKHYGI